MGLSGGLTWLVDLLFGERNVVRDTVEVFRVNAENDAARGHRRAEAALAQFAAEFGMERRGRFDRLIDGLNRVPRPAMALGTLGLFVAAMVDPIWFAERMQGIALVPEPLWWLLGAVVSFYFGARHQAKSQDFQRSIAATLARAPQVTAGIGALRALEAGAGAGEADASDAQAREAALAAARPAAPNAALSEWRGA
jgi:hypothetical protein